jgi:hypothetical protein
MVVVIRWVPDLVADAEAGRASSVDVLNSIGVADVAA